MTYQLLFDLDAQHRGLVHVAGQTAIVRDGSPVTITLGDGTRVRSFVREGIVHIWRGIDHVLFLVCLILPAVWRRDSLRAASKEVFEIVTAFTLGLLHGFGFSSVLIDLGLPSHELIGALLGFNAGVELGQAAIVIALLPLLYLIRETLAYQALLWAGSSTVALIAMVWSYQRWVA